jgi:thiol-disulfide isomerase/thioredoxin
MTPKSGNWISASPKRCVNATTIIGKVLIATFLTVSLAGCDEATDLRLAIGDPLPEFLLSDFAGNTRRSTAFTGKVLVVNFWASWCGPCRSEMPGLVYLASVLDPQHYQVIGISVDSDQFLAEEFLQQAGLTFPNFHDPRKLTVGRLLEKELYPQTLIFDTTGTLAYRMVGERNWRNPQAAILLADLLGISGSKG